MAIPDPFIQLLSKMKQKRPLGKKTLTLANKRVTALPFIAQVISVPDHL